MQQNFLIRISCLFLLTSLLIVRSFAQYQSGSIKGTITTKDGKPAPSITIMLGNTKQGGISDENGNYYIKNIKPGNYTIKISAIGIQTQEQSVEIESGKTLQINFPIAETETQLQQVEVKSMERSKGYTSNYSAVITKFPVAVKDIPNSVSIMTRQLMNDLNMATLSDVLNQATGVTSINYGDGTGYYQSRGYPLQIQYDGLPSNNGVQYIPQFDMSMYDNVQILRGPAGILQGSSSAAGILNLNRKTPLDTFGIAGALSAGSWNNFRGNIDLTTPFDKNHKLKGRFVVSGDDRDYSIKEQHSKHYLGYGILQYDASENTTLTLSGNYEKDILGPFDYGAGITDNGKFLIAPRNSFFGTPWSKSTTQLGEVYADIKHNFSSNWHGRISFDHRNVESDGDYGYIVGPISTQEDTAIYDGQVQHFTIDWTAFDANVTGTFNWLGQMQKIAIGVNYSYRNESSKSGYKDYFGNNIFDINIPQEDLPFTYGSNDIIKQYGAYAQAYLKLSNQLSLSLGGRLSKYSSKSQSLIPTVDDWINDPKTNVQFTPYAGLVYDLTKELTLYASYSNVFAPQTEVTESGKTLAPEKGNQYEAGIKGSFFNNTLNASVAGFLTYDENRAIQDTANPNFYLANGKVRSSGIEAEVSGNITRELSILAGYTYLDTKYITDPTNQGNIYDAEEPNNTFKLWASYNIQQGVLKNFRFGLGGTAVSKADRGFEVQKGFALVNAQIGYNFIKKWSATFTMNNIFDKFYYARIPSLFYGVYGDPRNFMFTLRKEF